MFKSGILHIQLSWICTTLLMERASDIFYRITGDLPENSQVMKQFDTSNGGASVAASGNSAAVRQVAVTGNRLDAFIGLPGAGSAFDGRFFMPDSNVAWTGVQALVDSVEAKLDQLQPYRLAVIVSSRTEPIAPEDCVKIITDATGISAPANALDTAASFTLRKPIGDTAFVANQIAKWTQVSEVQFGEASLFFGNPVPLGETVDIFYVQQDVDVNTVPVPRPIEAADRAKIWPEIIAAARSLVTL